MNQIITAGDAAIGHGKPLVLIAGPCVIENQDMAFTTAGFLKNLAVELGMPLIFKASYDKANRTSLHSFRGPGISQGLEILGRIKTQFGVQILSDVHTIDQIEPAAEVLDIIQIPAFLCRQTDFVLAAAATGKVINIKKGQFLAPWDIPNIIEKMTSTGNDRILITERGTLFGYNNLVVDFRGLSIMRETGFPVIFDATHSVQLPGGAGASSGGQRQFAPVLARAAVAAGADGIFVEVHPDPDRALCDGPNSLKLDGIAGLIQQLKAIREAITHSGDR